MKRSPKADPADAPSVPSDRIRVRLDVSIKLFAIGVLNSGRSTRVLADGTAGIRLDVDRRKPRRGR